mgnify:CR=1 FL=1
MFVTMVTTFSTTFMGSSLNLSIPAIGAEFDVSAGFLGWVITAYMLTVAAFSVPFGRLADIVGRKKIFMPGVVIFSVSSLLCAFSWNIWFMIGLRVIQGLSGSMIYSTNIPFLINAFEPGRRGRVLGFNSFATYLGLSLGPVIGGLLNYYAGWRSIFIVTFAIGITAFIVAINSLPADPKRGVEQISSADAADVPGNLLYIVTIGMTIFGLTMMADIEEAVYIASIGVVAFGLFVFRELHTNHPLIKISLFTKDRGFAFSNLSALLNYGATFATGYLVSIYLQVVMGYSSQTAGVIMISQPVVMAIVSPMAGRLSDKFSPYKLSSFGMGLCAAGLMFFVFIHQDYPVWMIIIGLIVTGLGFGFFTTPNTNAIMALVEKKDYGVASSILTTMRSVGHASSMALVTIIVGLYMGDSALSEADPAVLVQTLRTTFTICIYVCVCGVFFSLARGKR